MPFVLDIVNMKVGRSGRLFCCRVVLNVSLIAGGASAAAFEVCRRFRRSRAHCLAERGSRASRAEMTTRRRMVMRHGVRARRFPRKTQAGASVGKAARRRKRAGRGYMLPSARVEHGLSLRQRTLPPMPEERNTSRTEPSTRFYNRTFMFLNLTEQKIQDKNSDSHMR